MTGDDLSKYLEMLGNVKYNYDKLHGNSVGKRVNEVSTRVSLPVHGGSGITIYKFFDIKTKKYLGGGGF